MATSTTPEQSMPDYGLSRLLKRARHILFKEGRGKGRISRGELWVANALLRTIITISSIIFFQISPIISIFLPLVFQGIRGFSILIKRSHDLNKSRTYRILPVITTGIFCGTYFAMRNRGDLGFFYRILLAGSILAGIRLFVVILDLSFHKGKSDTNQYGSDPLIDQPKGNEIYRGTCILLFIATAIISVFAKSGPVDGLQQQFMQQKRQEMFQPTIQPPTAQPTVVPQKVSAPMPEEKPTQPASTPTPEQ